MRSADEFLTLKLLSSGSLQNINRDILIEAIKDYATEYAKEALRLASDNFDIEDIEVTEGGIISYERIQHNILNESNLPKHK